MVLHPDDNFTLPDMRIAYYHAVRLLSTQLLLAVTLNIALD